MDGKDRTGEFSTNQTSKVKTLVSHFKKFTVKSLNMFLGKLKAAAGTEGISSADNSEQIKKEKSRLTAPCEVRESLREPRSRKCLNGHIKRRLTELRRVLQSKSEEMKIRFETGRGSSVTSCSGCSENNELCSPSATSQTDRPEWQHQRCAKFSSPFVEQQVNCERNAPTQTLFCLVINFHFH